MINETIFFISDVKKFFFFLFKIKETHSHHRLTTVMNYERFFQNYMAAINVTR